MRNQNYETLMAVVLLLVILLTALFGSYYLCQCCKRVVEKEEEHDSFDDVENDFTQRRLKSDDQEKLELPQIGTIQLESTLTGFRQSSVASVSIGVSKAKKR